MGDNDAVNKERRQHNPLKRMDIRSKAGADGLRGVKTKGNHQRIGPRQQQNLKSTLDQWLVKPRRNPSTADRCQIQEDVEMDGDDSVLQSTSAQVPECTKAEKPALSDSDEDTQPMTPQHLYEDNPVSPAFMDSAESEHMQTLSHNYDTFKKEEVETCSATQYQNNRLLFRDIISRSAFRETRCRQGKYLGQTSCQMAGDTNQ